MKSLFSWVKRLSKIFEKRPLRILLLLSFFICILSAAIPIGFLLPEIRLEGSIPLHYNIYFGFDVLLTNPPFAGDVKERAILKNYLLFLREIIQQI